MAGTDGSGYLRTPRARPPSSTRSDEVPDGRQQCPPLWTPAIASIAAGITVHEALKAEDTLAEVGVAASVVDAYSIKPLDAAGFARPSRGGR